ncbi:MAG: universal stress protein [Rhodocyclaceae bacterium]|nr:universal stress protein [Rhodocyclaceae bacterium]
MTFSRILLCVDGEPHTEAAVLLALDLARVHGAVLDALYVVDPYLKKFTNEIYAINRDECRAHLDRSLAAEGDAALDGLITRAAAAGMVVGRLLEHGLPEEVIPHLTVAGGYDLVVLGGKRFSGRYERWTSRDLPSRLDGKLSVPVLLARV